MTDYQNPDYDPVQPEDPFRGSEMKQDPRTADTRAANTIVGWVAAGVLIVAVLAVVFGLMRQPGSVGTNTASNDITTPTAPTHMMPPAQSPPAPSAADPATPAPINPAPAPAAPAQPGGQ
jgi:hypothetical protein